MSDERELPPEHGIVSGRMSGALSVDHSFESLYKIYTPVVVAWLVVRVESNMVEDLVQDVWTAFYRRWRTWQQPPEMNSPAARPVLSFLFRTVHLTAKAHHRGKLVHEPIEEHDPTDHTAPQRLYETLRVQLNVRVTLGCPLADAEPIILPRLVNASNSQRHHLSKVFQGPPCS